MAYRVKLLLVVLCYTALFVATPLTALAYHANVGERAANFGGYDIVQRKPVALDDYLGQWVFVEFWSSWCGYCIDELPGMLQATAPYVATGELAVVTVTVDEPETINDMKQLIRKFDLACPVVYAPGFGPDPEAGFRSIPAQEWGITGVPDSFLIDPQGVIVAAELRGATLAGALEFYLRHQQPMYGLRGFSNVRPDGSVSIMAEVLSPEMKDLELELYLYKARLVWDAQKNENVWDIVYANDLDQTARIKFTGAREAVHEFIIPPDEALYQMTYFLKVRVPGGEQIGPVEDRGLRLHFQGRWLTLLDIAVDNGKFTIKNKLWPAAAN